MAAAVVTRRRSCRQGCGVCHGRGGRDRGDTAAGWDAETAMAAAAGTRRRSCRPACGGRHVRGDGDEETGPPAGTERHAELPPGHRRPRLRRTRDNSIVVPCPACDHVYDGRRRPHQALSVHAPTLRRPRRQGHGGAALLPRPPPGRGRRDPHTHRRHGCRWQRRPPSHRCSWGHAALPWPSTRRSSSWLFGLPEELKRMLLREFTGKRTVAVKNAI